MAGEDEDYGSARITIDLDDAQAVSDARDLGLRIARALDRATRTVGTQIRRNIQRGLRAAGAITVPVEPDLRGFDRALVRGLSHINGIEIPVIPDLRRFDRVLVSGLRDLDGINVPIIPDLRRFDALLLRGLRGLEISIPVVPDLDGFDARIRAHRPPAVPVPVNPDVDNDRLTRALAGIGGIAARVGKGLLSALKFGAIGIAAVGAATGVAKFVAALAPAAGLLAAVPAAILGFQAALGALKLALNGVSDAFKAALSGDSKEFEKSLEGLSPKAQAAAREVRAMKPAFEELRNSVQDAFFTQIEGQITATAKALRGPLLAGLTSTSKAWGSAARGVLGYVQGAQGVSNIRSILGGAEQAVVGLSQTTNKLTAGLLQVAAVVSDRFGAELSSGIANLGDKFGEWLQRIAQGGQAVSWVDQALNTLARLGDLAGNIGEIFSGVWQAAGNAGAGFLDRLQTITQSVADFVKSTAGQTALGNIFTFLGQVSAQVGPIVGALLTQLGGIAPQLAPLLKIGPLLVQVINGLGTAVQGALPDLAISFANVQRVIVALVPALPPLAAAFAALVRSATDLLVPLAPVVTFLAKLLGPVISLAAPLIVAATVFLGLVKALKVAQGVIVAVRAVWLGLQTAFAASPIGIIVIAVIALGVAIYLLYQRFAIVRTVVNAVGNALKTAFLAAVGFVKDAASKIGTFFVGAFETAKSAVSTGVDAVVTFFTGLPGKISGGLSSLGSSIADFFTSAFTTVSTAVQTGITAVVDFFTALPGQIVAALLALPGLLVDAFTSAVAFAIIGLLTVIAGIVFVFTELPGKIYDALVSLGTFLISAFTAGFNLAVVTVRGWIDSTVAFFEALPGKIYDALVSLGTFLISAFTTGFNLAVVTVRGWINSTVAFFKALPGKVLDALSSLGSSLLRFFTTAFNSAKTSVTNGITAVVGFFRGLPGKVASVLTALPGKISSAFTSAASSAKRAVSNLISGIVNLFSSLGSKIVSAMGNIGAQIVSKVKSGLPSSVRKYLPFAKGGIVYGPTHALIGEAGPEVVIPLTKPKRAMDLAARSGLLGILGIQQTQALAAVGSGSAAAVTGGANDLRKALTGIASLLDGIGADVVAGMVAGIRDNTHLVVAAAADMAASVETAARDTLDTHSPSKVFKNIGVDVGRGLVVGLNGTVAQVKAAAQRVANGVVKVGREIGIGFLAGVTGSASSIKSTTTKLANDIAAAFKGVKSTVDDRLITLVQTSNQKLQKLAVQRDAITQKIADAQKFATETAQKALDAFSLQNLTQGDGAVTAKSLTAGLEDALTRVKTFSAQLANLAKRGLSKDLLTQLVGLGPDAGEQIAAALAGSTKDSLKRLSSLQSQLSKASTSLGQASADVLFDAGKNAGAGFLAGLQGQRKNIEKLMLDIAKGMQASIRAALRIHSPSRVFMAIGDLTGLGLHIGFLRRLAGLKDESRAAARALADGVRAQLSGLGSSLPDDGVVIPLTRVQRARQARADGRAAQGAAAAGTGPTINNTFHIREVGDGQDTAHRVVNRLVLAAGVF
ncbi:hypothetical protein [Streptomyces sp. NPDC088847]|uniref:hypothetical protein n=1 Tax=Streptomyces sp. NPDC088847 TaxID=3365909 RepID=UPI0038108C0B